MMLDIATELGKRLEAEIPGIVELVNAHYAAKGITAQIAAPKEGNYLKGIRSKVLDMPGYQMPVIMYGIYGANGTGDVYGAAPERRFSFMVQVWLAHLDDGVLDQMADMWADALEYFINKHCVALLPGLRAPLSPDIDKSNSDWGADNYYRQVVQAGGEFKMVYKRPGT